jgi:hypothetical protein
MPITLTLAPAMAAPLESVTIPSMVARSAWASRKLVAPTDRANREITQKTLHGVLSRVRAHPT